MKTEQLFTLPVDGQSPGYLEYNSALEDIADYMGASGWRDTDTSSSETPSAEQPERFQLNILAPDTTAVAQETTVTRQELQQSLSLRSPSSTSADAWQAAPPREQEDAADRWDKGSYGAQAKYRILSAPRHRLQAMAKRPYTPPAARSCPDCFKVMIHVEQHQQRGGCHPPTLEYLLTALRALAPHLLSDSASR